MNELRETIELQYAFDEDIQQTVELCEQNQNLVLANGGGGGGGGGGGN